MKSIFKHILLLMIVMLANQKHVFAQNKTAFQKADSVKNEIRIKRSADSLAREITKKKNAEFLDSIKSARVLQRSVDSFKRVQAKNVLVESRLKSNDSIRLEKERILRGKTEEKIKLVGGNKVPNKIREKWIADSLKQIEVAERMIQKQIQKRIDDSVSIIELAEKAELEATEKLAKQEQKRTDDSLKQIAIVQKAELEATEKLAKQEQKRTEDSLKQIAIIKKAELETKEKLAKQEQKRTDDSLKQIAIVQKAELEAKEKLAKQESIKEAKSKKKQKNTIKDSLKQIEFEKKLDEEKRIEEIIVQKELRTNRISDSLLNIQVIKESIIDDSLAKVNQRIRLMNLKYRKQTIEDSLYLVKQNNSNVNIDSIYKSILLNEELQRKNDSIAHVKSTPLPDSIKIVATKIDDEIIKVNIDTNFILIPKKRSTIVSFIVGSSNYLGDLGGNSGAGKAFVSDITGKQRTFFYGIGLSRFLSKKIGIRVNYISGKIAGGDYNVTFKNEADPAYYRYKRNLDFQTKISEFSISAEVYPLHFLKNERIQKWNLQPYGVLGFGIFGFNPQGSYYDEIAEDYVWIDLKPLQLEGQGMSEYPNRKPYATTQINVPLGLGLQYSLGKKSNLSFEFIGRKLFTDYLDDVSTTYINPTLFDTYLDTENASIAKSLSNKSNQISPDKQYQPGEQRGNPDYNDFYYSFNIKLSIQLSQANKKVRR